MKQIFNGQAMSELLVQRNGFWQSGELS